MEPRPCILSSLANHSPCPTSSGPRPCSWHLSNISLLASLAFSFFSFQLNRPFSETHSGCLPMNSRSSPWLVPLWHARFCHGVCIFLPTFCLLACVWYYLCSVQQITRQLLLSKLINERASSIYKFMLLPSFLSYHTIKDGLSKPWCHKNLDQWWEVSPSPRR